MKSGRHSYSKLPLPSTDDSLSIPIPNLADSPSRISSDVRSIYSSTTSLASTSAFIAKKPIALTLHSTSYSVKDGKRQDKQILSNVSCFVKPGQLLAVLGSSGAGKSTLLDILADRRKSGRLENKLWVNGMKPDDIPFALSDVCSYVLQDDSFIAALTVTETLTFAQRMFRRKSDPLQIEQILRALHLDDIKLSRVGDLLKRGISGGQRRRLSIAIGLLNNPSVLLLDEPTSGLDSVNALRVMTSLAELASLGLTCVASIHQPRSAIWKQFDTLLLLHKGRTAYFGPASGAVTFFEPVLGKLPTDYNPADFLLDGLETNPELDDFTESEAGQKMLSEILSIREKEDTNYTGGITRLERASLPQRTLALIHRTWVAKIRNGREFIVTPLVVLFLAVLCGSLFYNIPVSDFDQDSWHRIDFLLFGILMFSLFSLPQLGTYISERVTFQRERAAGMYSALEFFTAATVCDVPLQMCITLLFTEVCFEMVKLTGSRLVYACILFLVLTYGHAVSHFISLLSSDAISALSGCMCVVAYSYLLNGQLITREDMNPNAIGLFNTSYVYNSFIPVLVNEFSSPEMVEMWGPTNEGRNPVHWFGFEAGDMPICIHNLILGIAVFRLLTFMTLKYKYKELR
ncbi:hypothetical protein TL16_g06402 [Triparma laevis f. inornata]|uniref:ABC transporter domain-containing protein n=2 Tax=Triparma laevis TaxID=1534972 RepID=A0A9W7KYV0_9STRA|nr:hypothetical protein TL16_g06402 [Triparma laevis f. inornata]GMI16923.1 hypothetical protein TrLO_g7085 [Triparma laevis f. longispina]